MWGELAGSGACEAARRMFGCMGGEREAGTRDSTPTHQAVRRLHGRRVRLDRGRDLLRQLGWRRRGLV